KSLWTLGIDISRLLDRAFPSAGHVALLVYCQYAPKLTKPLSTAKVPICVGFDLLHPSYLADPALTTLLPSDCAQKVAEIHHACCLWAAHHLAIHRPTVARAVAHNFVQEGWIAEE
ncbi:hypothetical protein BJ085DRAFT_7155, partial [Dimargaris cristalligena]